MQNPNDPVDQATKPDITPPLPPVPESADHSEARKSPLDPLKVWMATLAIPVPFTFGALVLAAFLLFPAYKGLTSGSTIRQLQQANQELQKQKDAIQIRAIGLEREVAGRDLQLTQRQRAGTETGSGLYLSPLFYLDGKNPKTRDLINIDFTQADHAILVFSLPKLELQEVEVSIYQEARLVWNQTLALPKQKLFGENLVTLFLKGAALGKGNYRMTFQGNPTAQRVDLSEFDITIES